MLTPVVGQQEGRYLINIVFGYAHESDAEAILPSQTYLVQYNFDAVSAAELSVASGDIVRITDKEGTPCSSSWYSVLILVVLRAHPRGTPCLS